VSLAYDDTQNLTSEYYHACSLFDGKHTAEQCYTWGRLILVLDWH